MDISQELLRPYNEPVMSNIRRADYIEAVVATALRPAGWSRTGPWASWDFRHVESGCRLELKQSAARQSWGRAGPARFDIAPRTGYWDEVSEKWYDDPGRHAHVYVFAWHPDPKRSADQRDPASWFFYVTPERKLPRQKTIGLSVIDGMAEPCRIDGLPDELRSASCGRCPTR